MKLDVNIKYIIIAMILLAVSGVLVPNWLMFLMMIAMSKGVVVIGVMLLMRMGLVSFGQGLYYCLGGYTAGVAGEHLGITDASGVLFTASIAALVVSALLGLLLCRYRGIFFAMFSMAFSMVLFGLLLKTPALGSSDGFNVHSVSYFGFTPTPENAGVYIYLLTCIIVMVSMILVHIYTRSSLGYAAEAVRENEIRVEYLGFSALKIIYAKYIAAAVLAAIGGALTAIVAGHVDPEMAYWTTSGEFVFVALLGGTTHAVAPFLGSFLFEIIRTFAFDLSPHTWQMILGSILLLIIIFLPKGLWSLVINHLINKKHKSAPKGQNSVHKSEV